MPRTSDVFSYLLRDAHCVGGTGWVPRAVEPVMDYTRYFIVLYHWVELLITTCTVDLVFESLRKIKARAHSRKIGNQRETSEINSERWNENRLWNAETD